MQTVCNCPNYALLFMGVQSALFPSLVAGICNGETGRIQEGIGSLPTISLNFRGTCGPNEKPRLAHVRRGVVLEGVITSGVE